MFQPEQQIGSYTLIRKLGEGGFGEVWLAENRNDSSSEKVAIKLPRKEQIDLAGLIKMSADLDAPWQVSQTINCESIKPNRILQTASNVGG